MGAGAPVLAFDVEFSHEVTAEQAFFWADADALTRLLDQIAEGEHDARLVELRALGQQRVRDAYQWDTVTDDYEALIGRLAARRRRR
jgi:glycosyltransferase involved in cell wall biosynthesis